MKALVSSVPVYEQALPAPDDGVAPTEPRAISIRNVHELVIDYGIVFD